MKFCLFLTDASRVCSCCPYIKWWKEYYGLRYCSITELELGTFIWRRRSTGYTSGQRL